MIVATWNVNSILVRLPHLIEWIKANKPNVVCLQETKTIDGKFPCSQIEELGYNCNFFGEKTYNGVAILSDRPLQEVRKGFVGDDADHPKRLIEALVDSTYIVNVYIPNGSEVGSAKYEFKLEWLSRLQRHIAERHNLRERVVLCGDFNIATDDIDCYDAEAVRGTIMVSDAERSAIAQIKEMGFVDTFRMHNTEGGQFSWWDYRMGAFRRNMGFRIDHIWASKPLSEACTRAWIDKAPRRLERPSDHAPVVAEFN